MCTTEHLEKRYKQVYALIVASIEDTVDMIEDETNECIAGKASELACGSAILTAYNTLFALIISRRDELPMEKAEAKAKDIISNMVITQALLAEMPLDLKPN